MKSFRPTADLFRKRDALNFFPANDDVAGFFEMYAVVACFCCLNEVVRCVPAKYDGRLENGPLVCAVNPSGRRAIATRAIPIFIFPLKRE